MMEVGMRRIVKLLSVVPMFAFAVSACDTADSMTAPSVGIQQQSSALRAQPQPESYTTANPLARKTTTDEAAPKFGMNPELASGGSADQAGAGVAYLGAAGGIVKVYGRNGLQLAQLVVPAGAVDAPALFTVLIGPRGDVFLAASRKSYNDVGKAGFALPVRLYVNPTNVARTGAAGLRAGDTLEGTSTRSISGRMTTTAKGSSDNTDPNSPPGEGWIWVELEGFLGAWVYIG
jgi:hypothetical protein